MSKIYQEKDEHLNPRPWLIITSLLLSLAVVLGFTIYNFTATYQNAYNNMLTLSKTSAEQNTEKIELFFSRHKDILLATSEILEYSFGREDITTEDQQLLLRNVSDSYNGDIYRQFSQKDFTGIYSVFEGELIHSYKTEADQPNNYDPLTRPWYIETVAGGGDVVFTEPYYDVYSPYLAVISVGKLLSDGESVVCMDISLNDIQYLIGDMHVTMTVTGEKHDYGHGLLLTDEGVVLTHWEDSELGKSYAHPSSEKYPFFKALKEFDSTKSSYFEMNIDGLDYAVFPQKLSNGWYLVTLTDLGYIRISITQFSTLLVLGTMLVILLTAFYCLLIFRAYMRSEKLSKKLKTALNLAKVDTLTNLGNRTAYDMKLKELTSLLNTEKDAPFALIMMDLNDLKYINDHFGHDMGDKYIINCCDLIRSFFKTDLYRIGGDEFAMFLHGDEYLYWEESCAILKLAMEESNSSLTPSVDSPSLAIGVAVHTVGDGEDIESLIRKADTDMYSNKIAIKQIRLEHSEKGYVEDLKLKLLDRQLLSSEMQKGLDEEQFEVWFQPQVNYSNGALIGAEALVRWRHPERGMVSPASFIPLFEYNGLIYELDKYVWEHAAASLRKWLDDGMTPPPVSVNVSRYDILKPDFVDTISGILKKYDIPHDLISLEVTESAFSDDGGEISRIITDLTNLGFLISIDDFGSGYSSLSLLKDIHAHMVKLDMQFFATSQNQTRNDCIVESIIRMVKMLGMGVLAEGVEEPAQAERLYTLGCTYIQGYLYSKPLTYAEYVEYMKTSVSERVRKTNPNLDSPRNDLNTGSQDLLHDIISGTNDSIIVIDNTTNHLLYANSAAEKFFGKRFDPLSPITCMEYCGKGELCENCPARDLAPGERREIVSKENGTHLRILFTQMDWNGRDAFVMYQTDITSEMQKIEFTNSLLNNLGVGIAIFRGDTPSELVPEFCNNEYLQLSGLTAEEFQTKVTKSFLYNIHPDDIEEARKAFREAYKNDTHMRLHIRALRASGDYVWVAMHAQIKKLDNGSMEVFMVFWDAEDEMQKYALNVSQYNSFLERRKENIENSLSAMHFNLSKDTCKNLYRSVAIDRPVVFENGISEFIDSVYDNIADEQFQKEFVSKFNRKSLLENYAAGIFELSIKLPIVLYDNRIIWCYQDVHMSRNPNTGDIEAITILSESDQNIRLSSFYQNIIHYDYELVASIDVKTCFFTIISEPKNYGLPNLYGSAVQYASNLKERMTVLVDPAYLDECLEAMSYETILKKLEGLDDYFCTFPANSEIYGEGASLKWHFGYVNGSKTEILFTRVLLK